jgi:hypothetical protein
MDGEQHAEQFKTTIENKKEREKKHDGAFINNGTAAARE